MMAEDGRATEPRRARATRRQHYDPEPISGAHYKAALESGLEPSEITAENARACHQAVVADKVAQQRAKEQAAAEEKAMLDALEAATPRPLPFVLPPKERAAEPLLLTHDGSVSTGRTTSLPHSRSRRREFWAAHEPTVLRPLSSGSVIDACSEFSGIGGFEHGLQAGFHEAGLTFRLIEASEVPNNDSNFPLIVSLFFELFGFFFELLTDWPCSTMLL